MTAQIFLVDLEFASLQTQEKVCLLAQIFLWRVCISPNSGESLYHGTHFSYKLRGLHLSKLRRKSVWRHKFFYEEFASLQTQEKVCMTAHIFLINLEVCNSPNSGESVYDGTDFSYVSELRRKSVWRHKFFSWIKWFASL